MNIAKEKELKDVCAEVMLLKHKLGQLGLFKSMHQMEDVTKVVGWEVAENLKASHPHRLSCPDDSMAREMAEIQRKRDRAKASRKKRAKK